MRNGDNNTARKLFKCLLDYKKREKRHWLSITEKTKRSVPFVSISAGSPAMWTGDAKR